MRKTEFSCNRCGADIGPEWGCNNHNVRFTSAKLFIWGVGEPRSYGGTKIDLCPECYEKLLEFLEGNDNAKKV